MARANDTDDERRGDQITLTDVDGMKTNKVGKNGTVFVGREYVGEYVTVAFRVEEEHENETEAVEATSD